MANRKMLVNLDLGGNQILSAVVEVLATAPGSPTEGRVYYDSTLKRLRVYTGGTGWVSMEENVAIDFGESGDIASSAPGDAAAAGSTGEVADAGHVHPRESFATSASTQAFGDSAAGGSATTVSKGDHKHAMPAHDGAAHSSISLSSLSAPTGAISFGSQRITNLAEPVDGTDAATRAFVEAAVAGLSWKEAARAGSSTDVTISGPGSSIGGVTLSNGDRVLLYGQSAGAENGVWVFNGAAAAMTRATDADSQNDLLGLAIFVTEGTDAGKQFVLNTDAPLTVGTTSISVSQFGAAQTYTAGDGLALAGNDFSVKVKTSGGIKITSDELEIDTAVVPRKYATSVGNGSLTTITVTHNLGTTDCIVQVFDNSTGATVIADEVRATTNTVTLGFNTAPTSNQYRCVVIG